MPSEKVILINLIFNLNKQLLYYYIKSIEIKIVQSLKNTNQTFRKMFYMRTQRKAKVDRRIKKE